MVAVSNELTVVGGSPSAVYSKVKAEAPAGHRRLTPVARPRAATAELTARNGLSPVRSKE
jgi:hypothetical protein